MVHVTWISVNCRYIFDSFEPNEVSRRVEYFCWSESKDSRALEHKWRCEYRLKPRQDSPGLCWHITHEPKLPYNIFDKYYKYMVCWHEFVVLCTENAMRSSNFCFKCTVHFKYCNFWLHNVYFHEMCSYICDMSWMRNSLCSIKMRIITSNCRDCMETICCACWIWYIENTKFMWLLHIYAVNNMMERMFIK